MFSLIYSIFQISYSEYALFFHDTYGGNVIGVVFKPDVFKVTDFKVNISFILIIFLLISDIFIYFFM